MHEIWKNPITFIHKRTRTHQKRWISSTPQTRTISTESTTAIAPSIVSRRAVYQYWKKHNINPHTSQKPKSDETPWPVSLQRVGYALVGLAIPFTMGAMIVEMPSFRRLLQGGDEDQIGALDQPTLGEQIVGWVRDFWAEEEPISEEERQWYQQQQSQSQLQQNVQWKSFDNEEPLHIRAMQRQVGQLCNTKQRVNVTILGTEAASAASSSSMEEIITTEDGTMLLGDGGDSNVRNSILKQLRSDTSKESQNDDDGHKQPPLFALEFLDDESNNNSMSLDDASFQTIHDSTQPSNDLRILTQTWSSWQYFPKDSSSFDNQRTTTTASNDDIRQSELEWKLAELRRDLSDPSCLKDIDDMQNELKMYERELRQLKRRGWSLF